MSAVTFCRSAGVVPQSMLMSISWQLKSIGFCDDSVWIGGCCKGCWNTVAVDIGSLVTIDRASYFSTCCCIQSRCGSIHQTWWALSRQCEIPWQFPDGSQHSSPCYSYHDGSSVIVSGGGRNATVHDPKPKWNAQAQQICSFRQLSYFSLTLPGQLSNSPTFPGFPDRWSPDQKIWWYVADIYIISIVIVSALSTSVCLYISAVSVTGKIWVIIFCYFIILFPTF